MLVIRGQCITALVLISTNNDKGHNNKSILAAEQLSDAVMLPCSILAIVVTEIMSVSCIGFLLSMEHLQH